MHYVPRTHAPDPRSYAPKYRQVAALLAFLALPLIAACPRGPVESETPEPVNETDRHTTVSDDSINGSLLYGWTKQQVTYRIDSSLPTERQEQIILQMYRDAANAWSEHIPLEITESGSGDADIVVQLCPRACVAGDCGRLCEDGALRYIGEAPHPAADEQLGQLILLPASFDSEEDLNRLYFAVLHEMGHSLGLSHSVQQDAVMHGAFVDSVAAAAPVQLHEDDIRAIQHLYGSRDETIEPGVPSFADIPTNPGSYTPPAPRGVDSDDDGLSDDFEELTSRTDPHDHDSDGDDLSDAFEWHFGLNPNDADSDGDGRSDWDEVNNGTHARAPVVCDLPGLSAENEVRLAESYLADAGLTQGEQVTIQAVTTRCKASGITIRPTVDSDCTIQIPWQIRKELCIERLHSSVPLLFCGSRSPYVLFDFEESIERTISEGGEARVVPRGEDNRVLEFAWSFEAAPAGEDPFAVLVFDGIPVEPCDRVLVDLEVESAQTVRIEVKTRTGSDEDAQTVVVKDTASWDILPGGIETVEAEISEAYAWREFAIVIERDLNEGTVASGTVWIDNIRLGGSESEDATPVAAALPVIYWTDNASVSIGRVNQDLVGVEQLATYDSGLRSPEGLALAPEQGKMYWADPGADSISRADLDGADVEVLVDDVWAPKGIALDIESSKIYWIDAGLQKIQRANLDGTSVEDLVTDLDSPEAIALDLENRKMYWTDSAEDAIFRANLNGTIIQELVTWESAGLRSPDGIALDVDGGKMYWADSLSANIQRADLDGSDPEVLVEDLGFPQGIALDLAGERMYWTDSSSNNIQRASLDGEEVEEVVRGIGDARGIAIAHSLIPLCSDGHDNDGDGKVDFPADPQCSGLSDFSEE